MKKLNLIILENKRVLVNLSFIVLFLTQIVVNLIAYRINQQLLDAGNWVSHTHDVIYSVNALWMQKTQIADEVSLYVQFRHPQNLKNYHNLVNNFKKKLIVLSELVKNNPQQVNNINLLKTVFLEKQKYHEDIIKKGQTINLRGQSLFKKFELRIYALLNIILNNERTLLKNREKTLYSSNNRASIFLKATNIFNLLLIALFLVVYNRQYTQALLLDKKRKQVESQLNGIIQGTNDSIAAIDLQYRLVNFNESFQQEYLELYGKPIFLGDNIKEYIQELPPEEGKLLMGWDKALQGQEFKMINKVQTLFGPSCWEITFSPVRDKANKLIGAAKISRNITDRLQMEQKMETTNKYLERIVNQVKEQNLSISSLNILGSSLQSCLTVEETFVPIETYAPKIMINTSGILYLAHPSRNYMDFVASWGEPTEQEKFIIPERCWALRRGQPHVFYNKKNSISCDHIINSKDLPPSICMPLQAQNDSVGLLYIEFILQENVSEEIFQQMVQDSELIRESFAETISLSLANIKLRDTLRHRSIRDSLTGLYNRAYLDESFIREIHRAQRQSKDIVVVMMDVDHFKKINDSFGHEAGDTVLIEIANILTKKIRQSDIICRYGGEEILLLMFDIDSLDEVSNKIEEIRVEISNTSFLYHGKSLGTITASFGIACLSHVKEPDYLITEADRALYISKKSGRNKITIA